MDLIVEVTGERPVFALEPWRPADQRYYVSSTARFERLTGWRPRVGVRQGVERLLSWLDAAGVAASRGLSAGKVAS
jgi:CDP-paratose 2-epimerase